MTGVEAINNRITVFSASSPFYVAVIFGTAVVTVVFAAAKFAEGAWIVIVLVPTLVFIFFRIHHHYHLVNTRLRSNDVDLKDYLAQPAHRIVLLAVNDVDRHTLPALRDLVQTGGASVARRAIHIDVHDQATEALRCQWREQQLEEMGVPLITLPSEFGGGDVVGSLVDYVRGILDADPTIRIELVIPEWTTATVWWQWLFTRALHHLTGSRLKMAFLAQNRVTVTNHRYVLSDDSREQEAARR